MAIQTKQMMTVADYLAWEERQEFKHEYIDGEIIEMTGGTADHSRVKVNLILALGGRLNFSNFIIYNSDMRVQVAKSRYVYPDLSVVRGEEVYEDESELTLLNPIVVVEVISPSSETRDRVDKREYYYDLPSIEAYLIVDPDRVRAELYTRAEDGWRLRLFTSADDVIPLTMLNCDLSLAQVYRGLDV